MNTSSELNIYKQALVKKHDYEYELPLLTAIRTCNVEHFSNILDIYEADLKFIEQSLICENKFWLASAILIVYGYDNIITFNELYSEYCSVETVQCDKEKCVVILLKSDNLTPLKVLCLSPKGEHGKMITLRIIKCLYSNGCLDINATTTKGDSLLCCTAASGMFDASLRLMRLGVEIQLPKLARLAMMNDQIKYLDNLYKRFGFQMYDICTSKDHSIDCFGDDNWAMFEFVVRAIMAEKQLSWCQIVNYRIDVNNSSTGSAHNTVFHDAVRRFQYGIAERCLPYSNCLTTTSQCSILPIFELGICENSLGLITKMLQIDPTLLEVVIRIEHSDKVKCVFHQLLLSSDEENVIKMYQKYPAVKKLFFKNPDVGLKYLTEMLSWRRYALIKFVLNNLIDVPHRILYQILNEIVENGNDKIELFQCVISNEAFNVELVSPSERHDLFRKAAEGESYQCFEILLQTFECDLNQIVWYNSNLLGTLFQWHNRPKTARTFFSTLLQKRVNFNTVCDTGKTLLHYFVSRNNFFATKKLLELQENNMNSYDNEGKLPIHHAITRELFQLLNTWTSKSYVNARTKKEGNSPLHLCMSATSGDYTNKLIQYIIENGGNVDAKNYEMKTPLCLAPDIERAKLLLEQKPILNSVTNDFVKVKDNHVEITKQHRPIYYNLFEAIKNHRSWTNELLDSPDTDVLIYDDEKNSLLHVAVQARKFDIIEKLIEKGVSIEHRNIQNETPLNTMCDHLNSRKFGDLMCLLNFNANVNVRNRNNESPIFLASQCYNTCKIEIIIELLLRDANILDCKRLGEETAYDNLSYKEKKLFKFLI